MFFYREVPTEIFELLPNNSSSEIFENPASILYNNTMGYYRSIANYGTYTNLNISDVWLATKIEATFTGYYNTPNNSLGQNAFNISYTDGTSEYLGIIDANSTTQEGQTIYKGDSGIEYQVQRDVIGETFTLTIPTNKIVKAIAFYSNYYPGYPEPLHGVKNIKIYKKPANTYTEESLLNNSAVSIFSNTANINWDSNRGYYRSSNIWDSNVDFIVSEPSTVKIVEGIFTGYYNNPTGCLGNNFIKILYTDNTGMNIGTADGNETTPQGQTIFKGDLGIEYSVQKDVIEKKFYHVIPPGKTLQKLVFYSNYLSGYPEAIRGVKDIKIYRS